MSRKYINKVKREKIAARALFRCEYCKIHHDDLFVGFEIDHIIALKHGGSDKFENLAYACPHCNANKGTDLTSISKQTQEIIPLFNPRKEVWEEHFHASNGELLGITEVGKVTINLLKMNHIDLLILRKLLTDLKRYP